VELVAGRNRDEVVAALDAIEELTFAPGLRRRTYELLGDGQGPVLDVGCGTGRAAAELAARGIRVVGVDASADALSAGRERHPDIEFAQSVAEDLPFAAASFRGYRAARLYHLLARPERAVAEAARVLGPGGRAVLAGQDHDMMTADADDLALTRAILRARADTMASPTAGRRYRALLLDAGFTGVTVEVQTDLHTDFAVMSEILLQAAVTAVQAGSVTREQAEAWLNEQACRGRTGRFLVAVPIFIAAGRKLDAAGPEPIGGESVALDSDASAT
jgi:ubiquinone/menaquinone biosynthesis C-methylase UbiE